jgi:adenylosuccinate synthase
MLSFRLLLFGETMKNRVVIGANFGDEGKGLTTDWLCSKHKPDYVVRFNGGAQAGHTVVTPEGKRHVFSHFGSGTFLGIPTILSRFFVVNPLLFWHEMKKLGDLNLAPKVFIDRDCYVTTPFEMLLNQFFERMRGKNRHGSCGVGFGETIEREMEHLFATYHNFSLKFSDLSSEKLVKETTENILFHYVFKRCEEMGYSGDKFMAFVNLGTDLNRLLADFYVKSRMLYDYCSYRFNDLQKCSLVFEGAQGLLLDQNHDFFPHVTRSNTGLKNVIEFCKENGLNSVDNELEVYYISRAYMTRHGAGPFPGENLWSSEGKNIVDLTNKPNEHQGSLRFAPLDVDLISKTVNVDFESNWKETMMKMEKNLVVTCLDQLNEEPKEVKQLHDLLKVEKIHTSHGPTREHVI